MQRLARFGAFANCQAALLASKAAAPAAQQSLLSVAEDPCLRLLACASLEPPLLGTPEPCRFLRLCGNGGPRPSSASSPSPASARPLPRWRRRGGAGARPSARAAWRRRSSWRSWRCGCSPKPSSRRPVGRAAPYVSPLLKCQMSWFCKVQVWLSFSSPRGTCCRTARTLLGRRMLQNSTRKQIKPPKYAGALWFPSDF